MNSTEVRFSGAEQLIQLMELWSLSSKIDSILNSVNAQRVSISHCSNVLKDTENLMTKYGVKLIDERTDKNIANKLDQIVGALTLDNDILRSLVKRVIDAYYQLTLMVNEVKIVEEKIYADAIQRERYDIVLFTTALYDSVFPYCFDIK